MQLASSGLPKFGNFGTAIQLVDRRGSSSSESSSSQNDSLLVLKDLERKVSVGTAGVGSLAGESEKNCAR